MNPSHKILHDLICRRYQDLGVGPVSTFKGKQVIGILAGAHETRNLEDKVAMDKVLDAYGFLKWFENIDFSFDPCSPSQTSEVAWHCDGPADGPLDGPAPTTTPAAVPRRVRQVPIPMRRAQVQVRPRLVTKFAGFRLQA